MDFNSQQYIDQAVELGMTYGPKLILAILTLVIGSVVIGSVTKLLDRVLDKNKFDITLRPYLVGIFSTLLKIILYISVIDMIGVKTTSFVAILGAAGLAVGLALQGSLGNFAGGVLILIFQPIKKGDLIEAQGVTGVVESIQPFVTVLLSPDNIVHYIPNGSLAGGPIKNYSINPFRRVDLTYGIGYGDNIDAAKKVFEKVAKACPNVYPDLGPDIFVSNLGDSSVDFAVRPYCKPEHYWDVFAYMNENVKKELDAAGISIPFPQRDIHLFNEK
jgi:small conductance mechanosensitive channel